MEDKFRKEESSTSQEQLIEVNSHIQYSEDNILAEPSNITWRHELECHKFQIRTLQEKLMEVKSSIQHSEDNTRKELELLWQRVKTTSTLLTYLKKKARTLADPDLTRASHGIKHQQGVGFVDRHGIPLSDWSNDIDLFAFEISEEEMIEASGIDPKSIDAKDGEFMSVLLKSVQMVVSVMEFLVKKIIMAENESAIEKEKVNLGTEEIRRKTLEIENMSAKLEDMENFAAGANDILSEMRQKVEELVQEASRHREQAAENEQELFRIKQDFEALRSCISTLISARETIISSEEQFQTLQKIFERLVSKTSRLEDEKAQKEAEVQKLVDENIRVRALLDQKEAQLLAMNEQLKFIALSKSGM
ncbi:uncharacterized protein [Typha latifolia]|uniref:uncharacterized protein n=1 Tax=Typha latifolia TaxID=4733 RepID=UPI003C30D917